MQDKRFISSLLKSNGTVLDIGCADGYLTNLIFQDVKATVTGIDKCQHSINIANDAYNNITFKKFDIESDNINSLGTFDIVTCYHVLHHIDDIDNIKRILKLVNPNGWLIIRTCSDSQDYKLNKDNPDLDWLLNVTGTLPNSSNRKHADLLEDQLEQLQLSYLYHPFVINTENMNSEQKTNFFDDNYGFRVDNLAQLAAKDSSYTHLYQKVVMIIAKQRENFKANKVFSQTNQPTFIIQNRS